MAASDLIDTLKRDTRRSLFRARNGVRYVGGMGRPDVGMTPKRMVWRGGKAQLFRYDSSVRSGRPPLVVVFSTLGRSYILDLMPGNSFVERLLALGNDVFVVDFGVPDAVDAGNTMDTYADTYLPRALRAALEESHHDEIDVLGYCFGGILAALCVAGHPELPVRSLALMATPIDFGRTEGVLGTLSRGRVEIEDLVDHTGNVPPEAIARMFRAFKPTADINTYATLWERLWNDDFVEAFQAMNQWVGDQVPFPGAFAEQCVRLLLRDNALMSGAVELGGRSVALAEVRCPVLAVVATHDHIVPMRTALPILDLVGTDETAELRVPAGHIGLVTSGISTRETIPGLEAWRAKVAA